ncbi:MAG: hypothetical protein WCJ42_09020 [Actinomycetes bacterium]
MPVDPTEDWTQDKISAAFDDLVAGYGPRPEPTPGVVVQPEFIDLPVEHFEPAEPDALPPVDRINRFAWAGVLGGPAMLLLITLTGSAAPGWLAPLAVGAFVAGFATLVARGKGRDPDDDGAVV